MKGITSSLLVMGIGAASCTSTKGIKAESEADFYPRSREKLAWIYDQMAACLRTEKTIDSCHAQMMDSCEENHVDCLSMAMQQQERIRNLPVTSEL